MLDFGSSPTVASTHHSRSRSLSPSKVSTTHSFFQRGSSSDQNVFEDIVLTPPAALTSDTQLRRHQSPSEHPSASRHSRPDRRTLTKSFLDNCRLPPLITIGSGSGTSSPTRGLHLPNPTPVAGSKDADFQRSPSQSPQPSPTKEKWEFMPTLTGDNSGQIRVEDKGGKLSNWFNGSSESVNLGILPSPIKEKGDAMEHLTLSPMIRPPHKLHRTTTSESAIKSMTSTPSRFSFFTSQSSAPKPPSLPAVANDELLNLDITTALFPGGPADPFSPSSFRNLLTNAEGLLLRLQTAYKLRTISLHEMSSETSAQQEELEEAETRARHLKMQLDDMAAKVAEKDIAAKGLAEELALERQQRREEKEARERSIVLVKKPRDDGEHVGVETDLSIKRHEKRQSNVTIVSDSGFESEYDSSADSVFSTNRGATSPPTPMSSVSGTTSPEPCQYAQCPPFTTPPQALGNRPGMGPQRPSTFQKILKGISTAKANEVPGDTGNIQRGCANCQGGNAAEAWSVVSVLRDENKGLKQRVGDLEGAVESCLDLVNGIRI
ncbi:MAG: hypothetical protein M1830_005444 [Pleopsidium flavum]|nr:MAG: hypothetical protein M1830_005444 [Pleopsidium flavum]